MSILAKDLNRAAIQRIGADLAHLYNRGTGVRVGIVSDGIMPHTAFSGRIKGGWDFVSGTALSDISGDNAADHPDGTSTAGIIAGSGVPFKGSQAGYPSDISILGVAPEAHLYDLRVSSPEDVATNTRVSEAINWAIDNGLEILVLQIGIDRTYDDVIAAIDSAYSYGIIMIAPVGNPWGQWTGVNSDWPNSIYPAKFPASNAKVIGVGEINHQTDIPDHWGTWWDIDWQTLRTVRWYHARDGSVDLVAPGGNDAAFSGGVGSTYGTDSTVIITGTHAATAFAAGVAALVISSGLAVNVADVRRRLRDTATAMASAGLSADNNAKTYGYGLINALLAAPPPSIYLDDIQTQRTGLGIGADGLGDTAKVRGLADTPSRVTVPVDTVPYLTRYPSPRNGETNVPIGNPIIFSVKSDTVGIDISTVRVKINGQAYKPGDPGFSFSGTRRQYEVEVKPASSAWGHEETVEVEIEAWDLAGKPGLLYERIVG
jgi:hypothetical protein